MVVMIILSVISWAAAILMLTGRGSFLIAGYNTSGKKGKELARKEYDIPGITKYLGKMIMLPLAVISSAILIIGLTGLVDLDSMNSFGMSSGITIMLSITIVLGLFGYIMFVLIRITSGRFSRK